MTRNLFSGARCIFTIVLILCCVHNGLSLPTYEEIFAEANYACDYLYTARQALHKFPEPSYEEHRTAQIIKSILEAHCIPYTTNWCSKDKSSTGTGIVAQIGTGEAPCIALRAVMDGKPISEQTHVLYSSANEGYMHATGNDANIAMLLGAANVLKMYEKDIKGTVKFIFQSAEDEAGAAVMCDEGVLSAHPSVESIFAIEVSTDLPTGVIASKAGQSHAASDDFIITVTGSGGHGGYHHFTTDPIPPSLAIMKSLSDMAARELYFQEETAGQISVTSFKTPSKATNVIPDEVVMGGTFSGLTHKTLEFISGRMHKIVEKIASSYKCVHSVTHPNPKPYPPLYNDENLHTFFLEVLKTAGIKNWKNLDISMESKDFAFYAENVPILMVSIGSGSSSSEPAFPQTNYTHNNPHYAIDERVLPSGIALNAFWAMMSIEKSNFEPSYWDEL